MGDHSAIEWTDATWPIVQGCDYVSPGCAHCYAPFQIVRQAASPNPKVSLPVLGLVEKKNGHLVWTGKVACRADRLDWPLRWTRPRRIFVPSLGDLFHQDVPDDFLHRVYGVMEHANRHTYQVLSKRVERMSAYLNWRWGEGRIPCRHIWHGASAENQETYDERWPHLMRCRSPVVFWSLEPLLGPIDLRLSDRERKPDWVICGGESGPGARACSTTWVRSIVEQCRAAGVPCFVKQLGSLPVEPKITGQRTPLDNAGWPDGTRFATYADPNTFYWLPGEAKLKDKKGGDAEEWPEDLRIREFPQQHRRRQG